MSQDYLKKEPTKTEKALAEFAIHLEMLDVRIFSASRHLLALTSLLVPDPEKLARLLATNSPELEEYGRKFTAILDQIDAEEKVKKDTENSARMKRKDGPTPPDSTKSHDISSKN